jgi:DNA-binding NarL/FixJ family response regulator
MRCSEWHGGSAVDLEVIAQPIAVDEADPLADLTDREREVLALMAEGCSNRRSEPGCS